MNKYIVSTVAILLPMPLWTAVATGTEIAGLKPDQRPEGAPVISESLKPKGWYDEALTGVTRPYPKSLEFLVNQGAWFSPFLHPGMTGPYDLRGWHRPAQANPAETSN